MIAANSWLESHHRPSCGRVSSELPSLPSTRHKMLRRKWQTSGVQSAPWSNLRSRGTSRESILLLPLPYYFGGWSTLVGELKWKNKKGGDAFWFREQQFDRRLGFVFFVNNQHEPTISLSRYPFLVAHIVWLSDSVCESEGVTQSNCTVDALIPSLTNPHHTCGLPAK
jgi:hypothetical protein